MATQEVTLTSTASSPTASQALAQAQAQTLAQAAQALDGREEAAEAEDQAGQAAEEDSHHQTRTASAGGWAIFHRAQEDQEDLPAHQVHQDHQDRQVRSSHLATAALEAAEVEAINLASGCLRLHGRLERPTARASESGSGLSKAGARSPA